MSTINNSKKQNNTNDKIFINSAIRVPKVLCIVAETGENLGVIATYEALRIASDAGLDLVQVSPPAGGRPPTCKILDYGKLKYEESKKRKAAEKKQREMMVETKELKFRPTTGEFDLQIKAKKASEFLDEGHNVKITIVFRGRELSHKEVAYETLQKFMTCLPGVEITSQAALENNKFLSVMINKKDDKKHQNDRQVNDNNG